MDIKALIKKFSDEQSYFENQINDLKTSYPKEEEFWRNFEGLNTNVHLNPRTMDFLADSLQLVNDVKRLESFDLQDIKRIYQLLVQYYPDNIQYQVDLVSFVHNVLDDEEEALELIDKAIVLIDKKRDYLELISNQIKKDR